MRFYIYILQSQIVRKYFVDKEYSNGTSFVNLLSYVLLFLNLATGGHLGSVQKQSHGSASFYSSKQNILCSLNGWMKRNSLFLVKFTSSPPFVVIQWNDQARETEVSNFLWFNTGAFQDEGLFFVLLCGINHLY